MSLRKIRGAIIVFVILVLIGGGVYSYLEGWSFLDAIYFSTVTVTTLGYGDFVPETMAGKVFTIFFSLSGIAIGLYILTIMGKYIFTVEFQKHVKKRYPIKQGKPLDVVKLSIGEKIEWHPSGKDRYEGAITEIGLSYAKINLMGKNGKLLARKDRKTIIVNSKGKLKKNG